ncbi:hypothetical protein ACFL2V_17975 [Pseudomonadota bacterium]
MAKVTTTFTIAAGFFGLVAIALHRESQTSATWFFTVLSTLSFLCALYANLKEGDSSPHFEERKLLLNSSLAIIDDRGRLTVEMVGSFRDDVNKYRYALSEEQAEFISHLLSAVGDVRINNTEIGSNSLSNEERKDLISENRVHLDKIERAREVIEKYLREST